MTVNLKMKPKYIKALEHYLEHAEGQLFVYDSFDDVFLCQKSLKGAIVFVKNLISDWRKLVDALEESKDGEQRC